MIPKSLKALTFLMVVACLNCNTRDPVKLDEAFEQTSRAIDDAIAQLAIESNDWQGVIETLQKNLTLDLQETIRVEIADLVSNTIGKAGVGVMCSADFFGTRIRQGLIRIRNNPANLIGVKKIELIMPSICNPVPNAIDLSTNPNSRKVVTYYGYDLKSAESPLKAFVEKRSGEVEQFTTLNSSSNYMMTLDISSENQNTWQRIFIREGEEELSSIPVLQHVASSCVETEKSIAGRTHTLRPKHIKMKISMSSFFTWKKNFTYQSDGV